MIEKFKEKNQKFSIDLFFFLIEVTLNKNLIKHW
jgi:hypothetical protein